MARSAVALVLCGSAAVALGAPDWGRAREFLTGGLPTASGSLALAVLLVWSAIGALAVVAMVGVLRDARALRAVRSRPAQACACLAVGVLALIAGTVHHGSGGYRACCGGGPAEVEEAHTLAR